MPFLNWKISRVVQVNINGYVEAMYADWTKKIDNMASKLSVSLIGNATVLPRGVEYTIAHRKHCYVQLIVISHVKDEVTMVMQY